MKSPRSGRLARIAVVSSAVALASLVTVGAVSSHSASAVVPSADSPLFAGLPRTVVTEVLTNPKALANVSIWPVEETTGRNALWQGMVINFTQCRQMLQVYEDWKHTGTAPALPALALPSNPAGDVVTSAKVVDTDYRRTIASGEIGQMANLLQNESGCGVWIPATAGDSDGPVIADVVSETVTEQ
jgi:hypothetical protein